MAIEQLQNFTNNATTTVPSTISNVATSITVATGTGALFPVLTGSEFFISTLVNTVVGDPGFGQMEIVKVTARSGDVMTVVRGQEGTSGTSFPTGCLFELRPTAQAFDNIYTEVLELDAVKAPLASPVFTGNPTAPTPSPGDNDTSIATSAFVTAAITAAAGRLINTQVFTTSGTWTKPAGTTSVIVYVVGGGGGGAGCPATSGTQMSIGAGGGAGGMAFEVITSGLGATEAVTVGGGGAGGSGGTGTAGSASSFGAHCTGNGGAGGTAAGPSTGAFFILGSAGGGSSGGTLNFQGGCGSPGMADATTQTAVGGTGGQSFFNGGGSNVSANNNGNPGLANSGGGGGGAANGVSQAARGGGNGGAGLVIVYSYN